MVEASQTIPITFQSTGIVTRVLVEEGDFVNEGQLLAEVEKGSLVSAYQGALAKYEQALDAQSRLKMVYDKGSLPEVKWVEINSQVAQAKSILEVSERNLKNCELRAPNGGIIGERNIEPGMSAIQIEAPIKLVKLKKVMVKISVPENEINKLQKGQQARITVSALNNKTYTGAIERLGVVANRLSRTYDVKIEVVNPALEMKPGMVCDVEISLPSSETVLLIPMSSVQREGDQKSFVYVIDQKSKRAIKKQVHIEGIVNDMISVSSGLQAGELIVVQGTQKLSDQSLVTF
jgi:RND family efflux transporter MFP subunit